MFSSKYQHVLFNFETRYRHAFDCYERARGFGLKGNSVRELEQYNDAIAFLDRILRVSKQKKVLHLLSACHLGKSAHYESMGLQRQALEACHRALDALQRVPLEDRDKEDHRKYALLCIKIANVYNQFEDYQSVLFHLGNAIIALKRIEKAERTLSDVKSLAVLYKKAGALAHVRLADKQLAHFYLRDVAKWEAKVSRYGKELAEKASLEPVSTVVDQPRCGRI